MKYKKKSRLSPDPVKKTVVVVVVVVVIDVVNTSFKL